MSDLNQLHGEAMALVRSFPKAHAELLDFHYKSRFLEYVEALRAAPGRKLVVEAESIDDLRKVLPIAAVMSDVVVFNSTAWAVPPSLSIFPIPDDATSPVLGMMAVVDENHQARPPSPAEITYVAALLAERAQERAEPEELLGIPWGADADASVWRRSEFTRTNAPYTNAVGEACHIVAGWIHTGVEADDPFFTEVAPLLAQSKVVFAPFLRLAPDSSGPEEGVLKSGLLAAEFMDQPGLDRWTTDERRMMGDISVPYLGGIDLPTFFQIIEDESESVLAVRRAIDRMLADVRTVDDPFLAEREFRRLKREVFEDEFDRLKVAWARVARMNALTRVGAYVTTATIAAAGLFGLAAPEILCATGGVATATVAELFRASEAKSELRRSPMQIAWRIRSRTG